MGKISNLVTGRSRALSEKIVKSTTINQLADGRFRIEESDSDGNVSPHVYKLDAREAVARVMQVLCIGPVAPQTEPEEVCIGQLGID